MRLKGRRHPLTLLFVLGIEVSLCWVDKAVEGGFLSSYALRGRNGASLRITHLLFEDDSLVFCKASNEEVLYFSWILLVFEATSGLKVNFGESFINLAREVGNVKLLTLELGCNVEMIPSPYLGLPLWSRLNTMRVWDSVEEKFKRRLMA